jgi:hypothetical protein
MTQFFSGLAIAAFAIAFAPTLAAAQVGSRQSPELVLGTRPATGARKPTGQLNTLNDLFAALRACWKPPALENAHPGMQMTMRFSFNREGKMIGPPQVTYATAEVTPKTRDVYREAMQQSLEGCTPFPFTSGLAGAIAGRVFSLRIVDHRDNSAVKPRA